MTYAEKIRAKRERYAARAAKKAAEARSREQSARGRMSAIPPGQPILAGHHSERRHRRDLERIDRDMRASFEADKQAAALAHKARTYGTHQISSDDPAAVDNLRAKLAKLEAQRERYKAHNREARKSGGENLPPYMLKNLGANIRRIKGRIAELEAAAERPERPPVEGDGWRIECDSDDNRIRIYFASRPNRATCQQMRRAAFKWAPSVGAWQRQITNGALWATGQLARQLWGDDAQARLRAAWGF